MVCKNQLFWAKLTKINPKIKDKNGSIRYDLSWAEETLVCGEYSLFQYPCQISNRY